MNLYHKVCENNVLKKYERFVSVIVPTYEEVEKEAIKLYNSGGVKWNIAVYESTLKLMRVEEYI